jgi:hypothetical protein
VWLIVGLTIFFTYARGRTQARFAELRAGSAVER